MIKIKIDKKIKFIPTDWYEFSESQWKVLTRSIFSKNKQIDTYWFIYKFLSKAFNQSESALKKKYSIDDIVNIFTTISFSVDTFKKVPNTHFFYKTFYKNFSGININIDYFNSIDFETFINLDFYTDKLSRQITIEYLNKFNLHFYKKSVPLYRGLLAYFFFLNFKINIAKRFPKIFTQEKSNSSRTSSSWIDIVLLISGDKFGDYESTKKTNFIIILKQLSRIITENQKS